MMRKLGISLSRRRITYNIKGIFRIYYDKRFWEKKRETGSWAYSVLGCDRDVIDDADWKYSRGDHSGRMLSGHRL